ncbi:MAG: hypothetical protein OEZ01_15110 [Candidatus Heimdallarchaeota archaeon]|nr:hypothetical protein [Candidatus Heimdallarchaeota archaeon]MDH5647337.1 hypothetical protein [Candidatus Heimdallarchaeota archaeon]
MSGIPLPNAGGKTENYTSACDKFDGNASTGGLCNGWITKTSTCTRRNDEFGQNCDGYGKFPALGK